MTPKVRKNQPSKPTKPPARAEPPPGPGSPAVDLASRGERRRRETRDRLLKAAFRLFAERGADAVPINEITEAADVGFGSFYNHFPSKEAIHEAVLGQVFDEFGDTLDRLTARLEDPAEVIAMSVRHAIQRARREPLWGKLLIRESYQAQVAARGLAPRLLRDICRGLESGRFSTFDPMVSFLMVGSSVLGAITAQMLPADALSPLLAARFDTRTEDLAIRTAIAVLQVLGIPRPEAEAIARRPLPEVESSATS